MQRSLVLFSYYGGKKRSSGRYPAPEHGTIVEPFAGSAGYACRYPSRNVILVEKNPKVAAVLRYLVRATPDEIKTLPLCPPGCTVDDLQITEEQRWLIGFWLNKAVAAPARRLSKWGVQNAHDQPKSTQFWGVPCRARLADAVRQIKHWRVIQGDYTEAPQIEATWFVDPPYQNMGGHYPNGSAQIDYAALGAWCRSRSGQVLVCESTGADWLPFQHLYAGASAVQVGTTRRSTAELIWTNRMEEVEILFRDTVGNDEVTLNAIAAAFAARKTTHTAVPNALLERAKRLIEGAQTAAQNANEWPATFDRAKETASIIRDLAALRPAKGE